MTPDRGLQVSLNGLLISLLVSRCRPNRSIDLLLRANLGPQDKAAQAWRRWLGVRSVEDATRAEARLLAPLALRLNNLDTSSPFRARLEGLAKAYWTQTQLMMRDSVSALDVLTNAGIDCLLLKGAAYYAQGLAPARRRIMGDIDVLVPSHAITLASDRLCEAGWSPQHARILVSDETTMSVNYWKGEYGDIDLHRYVFPFCRRDHDLDAKLWENARSARLLGRSVQIPSVADSIIISIAHGIGNGDGDWAIDVDSCIRSSLVEWDRVAQIADRRGLVPAALAGLTYLKRLGSDIPQSVLDDLGNARSTVGEYLKYFDLTLMRETRHTVPSRLVNAAHRIANPLLPRDRYQYRW
jgi:Uncharacterised nucleotidyltransferase